MLPILAALLLASPSVFGAYKLVLDEEFQTLNTAAWDQEVSLGGGGNWEFQAYTPEKENTYTRDGILYIKPTLTADKFGESFLTQGKWDMFSSYGKCTFSAHYGCSREGRYGTLNPVMSGKIMSKTAIKYGKVEVVAKLPRGDWIWPAIWMMPKNGGRYGGWPRSGEIDICESRGNVNYGNAGVDHTSSTLHWSVDSGSRYYLTTGEKKALPGTTFADGFHTFTLEWDSNGIKTSVDGRVVLWAPTPHNGYYGKGNFGGQTNIWANGGSDAPFDQEFYLILNVAVGGTNGFFPEISSNGKKKPWKNTSSVGPKDFWAGRNQWYPTWKGEDAAMQVKSVKMWQLQ